MRIGNPIVATVIRHNRSAFSLIELTVVLLILAISAAAVALRIHEPLGRARLDELVAEIGEFDALTRRYARENDRSVRLLVDLGAGRMGRSDEGGGEELGRSLELPGRARIARLWIGEREIGIGAASIGCSRRGLTPSYAMVLEDEAGRKRWILVAGLSGQVIELESDEEVRNVLETLREGVRGDAS